MEPAEKSRTSAVELDDAGSVFLSWLCTVGTTVVSSRESESERAGRTRAASFLATRFVYISDLRSDGGRMVI